MKRFDEFVERHHWSTRIDPRLLSAEDAKQHLADELARASRKERIRQGKFLDLATKLDDKRLKHELAKQKKEIIEKLEKMKKDLPPYTIEPEYGETLAHNLALDQAIKSIK